MNRLTISVRAAMQICLVSLLFLGAFCILIGFGCAPSPDQVVGSYTGTLYGAQEALVLRANGTLTQKLFLPDGRAFTTYGTWSVTNMAVDLSHYLHFYDEGEGTLTTPEIVEGILYRWDSGVLVRECKGGDYVLKRK